MHKLLKAIILQLLLTVVPVAVSAQNDSIPEMRILGVVVDEETGDSLQLVSMQYKKLKEAFTSNMMGKFDIPKREKQYLTITAIGYKEQRILIGENTPQHMRISLKPDSKHLKQVEVKTKKRKYSRKENPAVELMRRVIAANKATDLKKTHDYYKYTNYNKLTLAINDVKIADIEREKNKNLRQWLINQIMISPDNGKPILPLNLEETVTEERYRKSTNSERSVILGQKSEGISDLIETGKIMNKMADEIFCDIDLYKNQIKMLQYPFTSPIGSSAIGFYRYYIVDTLMVDGDKCIQLEFIPNNQQDFGFRGNLYVLADSTLHVRKCELTIPKKSDVNWVDNIHINLEYEKLPTGEWVLSRDDMFCELSIVDFLSKAAVMRTTRRTDYSFAPLPDTDFEGMGKERKEKDYNHRDQAFWDEHRTALLSPSEQNMGNFMAAMKKTKGFGVLLQAFKIITENFVEFGTEKHPSKVDFGPINTVISQNFVDGLRTRASLVTTPRLSSHFFLKGYYAHGWNSKKDYYQVDATYSFNAKENTMYEYPVREITLTSAYDNMAPSDRFGAHDKDNIFTMLKWKGNDTRIFYNEHKVAFRYEQLGGMEYLFHYMHEKQSAVGTIDYPEMTLSEFNFGIRYAPGESTVSTKRHRVKTNSDNPVYTLSHTVGLNGFLGGTHHYNTTEASIYYRKWLNNWGRMSVLFKGGVQWEKVPYMLLLQPPANTSFIKQKYTFSLMNEMEFLTDRYAMVDFAWDLNGRIFNRVPLLKHLKWREYLGFRCFYGTLTEKNKPTFSYEQDMMNPGSTIQVSSWPEGVRMLDERPYMEASVGIHNILKFFHVEYVRRLTYNEFKDVSKNGVRMKFEMTF